MSPVNKRYSLRILFVAPFLLGGLLLTSGCERGPAERAGAKIDNAASALNPKGPGEKLGERVDKATGR